MSFGETSSCLVLVLLVLYQLTSCQARGRRAIPNVHLPVSPEMVHTEPVNHTLICSHGTVSHGTVCCQPTACSKDYELKVCNVSGGEDTCVKCAEDLIQPNYITSLDEDTHCFPKPMKYCAIYDLKPYHSDWSRCALFCECRNEDCFWGSPCGCRRTTSKCGVNEQLNKRSGKCETCPWYAYKNTVGCEPCTANVTLWRSGKIPPPTTTSTIQSSSSTVSAGKRMDNISDETVAVDPDVEVTHESSTPDRTYIIVLIILCIFVACILVGIACWCCRRYCSSSSVSVPSRLSKIRRLVLCDDHYDQVQTEEGLVPNPVVQPGTTLIVDTGLVLPASTSIGSKEDLLEVTDKGIHQQGQKEDDNHVRVGDGEVEVMAEVKQQSSGTQPAVRVSPLGAERDLTTQANPRTPGEDTDMESSDRMSVPGQNVGQEDRSQILGDSQDTRGARPQAGGFCPQCASSHVGCTRGADARANVVFIGNELTNCNVVLCCRHHAQKDSNNSFKEKEMRDSSIKVAEVSSGVVPGKQKDGNTAAAPQKSVPPSNVWRDTMVRGEQDDKTPSPVTSKPDFWSKTGSNSKPIATIRPLPTTSNTTDNISLPQPEFPYSLTSYPLLHDNPLYNRGNMVADVHELDSMASGYQNEINDFSSFNTTGNAMEDSRVAELMETQGGDRAVLPTNHVCCSCCRAGKGTSSSENLNCSQTCNGSVVCNSGNELDLGKPTRVEHGHLQEEEDRHQTYCKVASINDVEETKLKSVDEEATSCKLVHDVGHSDVQYSEANEKQKIVVKSESICNDYEGKTNVATVSTVDKDEAQYCEIDEKRKAVEEASMCNNFEGKTNLTMASTDESFELEESEINRIKEVETSSEQTASEIRGDRIDALTACESDCEDDEDEEFSMDISDIGRLYGFMPPSD